MKNLTKKRIEHGKQNELPEKSYFYQMQVYMHLTGKKKAVTKLSDKIRRAYGK